MKPEYDLVLRTCYSDMTSYNHFKWPKKGAVKAPDWAPTHECGRGLHGLLRGCGDGNLLSNRPNAKWLVVKVLKGTCIDLGGKVKFPKGTVVYAGTKEEAVKIIAEAYPEAPVVFANRHSGDYGVSTSDYGGTSTSGNFGTSISGDYGKSISGDYGKSISDYHGASISGDGGTSISGIGGISTSGEGGTSTSSIGGKLNIKLHDSYRYRTAVAYVGENGIEPNVAYKLDDDGNFIKA
jgi:hypothetical protein